jgi:hydrogenase expression/formation protein HypC
MCLAVPGRLEAVTNDDPVMRTGRVNFGGVVREVNLAYVPEAQVGDYVIVHVGVALERLDEAEAQQVLATLRAMGELEEQGLADGEGRDA